VNALTPAQMRTRLQRAAAWLREREADCVAELARIQDERRRVRVALHDLTPPDAAA